MDRLVGTLLMFMVALSSVAVADTMQQFTVKGELIPDGLFVSTSFEERQLNLPDDMDWSKARVVVAREVVGPTDETAVFLLASGHFENGSITLSGEIEEPIDATILLEYGDKELSKLDVLLTPESTVSFVLMENHAHLELLGASRTFKDSEKKFTISGDFSFMADELEGALVRVRAGEYTSTGERVSLVLGRVVPDEGKFVIEAEVDEPRIVNVAIVSFGGHAQTRAIIEPGAKITIASKTDSLNEVIAISGKGKHAHLIESWQQSDEYLSTTQDYRIARQEYEDKQEQARGASSGEGATNAAEEETPKYQELSRKLSRLRYDFLHDVASNAEDPIDALLALELGAYRGQEEGLPIYDSLAKSLDKDLVARRVTHARNEHAIYIARTVNDRSLTVGKKAPDFTLQNFEGEKVSLSGLLDEKDFVLVDFWASWCGPCIATFPALKDLYASYRDHGFEIVSVSIDDSHEMWSYSTEEYKLPWINLGELKGFEGEMVMSYGVNFVPKGYLLDSEGQIVQKDLSTDQLKEFLVREYGDTAEVKAP